MDFTSPEAFTVSMIAGLIGLVVLRVGWRERQLPQLIFGSALMALPYVVKGPVGMIAGVCVLLAGLKVATRM